MTSHVESVEDSRWRGMVLLHLDKPLGPLVKYSYETPWASAWLEADDPATLSHYASISAFINREEDAVKQGTDDQLQNEDASADEDARYDEELKSRDLTDQDVDSFWHGWKIKMKDGETVAVSVSSIEADGCVTWRW